MNFSVFSIITREEKEEEIPKVGRHAENGAKTMGVDNFHRSTVENINLYLYLRPTKQWCIDIFDSQGFGCFHLYPLHNLCCT